MIPIYCCSTRLRDAGIFPATTGFHRHDEHAEGNTVSRRKIEARADPISLSRIKLVLCFADALHSSLDAHLKCSHLLGVLGSHTCLVR